MIADSAAARVQRLLFMRSLPASRDMGSLAIQLADVSRDVYFEATSTIYETGASSDFLYFIVRGEVALSAAGQATWSFFSGDGIGFLDALTERPRSRHAKAVTAVHTLAIHVEDWLDILEDNFALARAMVMSTCDAIHEKVLKLSPNGGFQDKPERNIAISSPPNVVERLMVLREEGVLERAGVQALTTLAALSQSQPHTAGEAIFLDGKSEGSIYIVAFGRVQLTHEEPYIRANFVRGQLVGSLAALGTHHFSAHAVTDAVLLRIRVEDWFDVMEDHFNVARSAIRFIATERERMLLAVGSQSSPSATKR